MSQLFFFLILIIMFDPFFFFFVSNNGAFVGFWVGLKETFANADEYNERCFSIFVFVRRRMVCSE